MSTTEEFFKELQGQLERKQPFVAYRKPVTQNSIISAFLQKDDSLQMSEGLSGSGFVFAPFDNQKEAVLIPEENSVKLETTSEFDQKGENSTNSTLVLPKGEVAKEAHIKLVQQAIDEIRSGAFKKVVLSRKEQLEIQNIQPLKIFRKLLQKYETAFVYCWYHPKVGLWVGATPETLLVVERNRFKTMSLAGTQKFTGSADVIWGEKEIEEQKIVTDSILENLKKISIGNVEATLPYTEKAGGLLHLRTDITGEFSVYNSQFLNSEEEKPNTPIGIGKLIAALHPTPAVCGLPREKAKEFILEHEHYDREFYTGFLGELNIKTEMKRSSNRRNQENQAYGAVVRSSALFVNLRCMKLDENRAYLFVGGGITKDSSPEAEWEETQNKSETIKAVL